MKGLLASLLRVAALVAAGLLVVVYPLLYLMQDRMLFLRPGLDQRTAEWVRTRFPGAEVRIPVADGVQLHGWFVPGAGADEPAPLLIYFGGNAEEVSGQLMAHAELPGWGLLLVNYRGFGLSGGWPSEAALRADALVLHDWAREQPGVDPARIVAWGRSLGSGPAVHLAAERPVAGVLLMSPYDSLAAVAQGHYPFVPVRWLFRHPFDVAGQAAKVRAPLLAFAVAGDRVVPARRSQALVDAWGGPRELVLFEQGDHNQFPERVYWNAVRAFLAPLAEPRLRSEPVSSVMMRP